MIHKRETLALLGILTVAAAVRLWHFPSLYYYLEDLYSWRSYAMVRSLMDEAGDSMIVYRMRRPSDNPATSR